MATSAAEAVRDKDEAPTAEIPPLLARPEEPKAEAPKPDAPLASFSDIATSLQRQAQELMPSKAEMDAAKEKQTLARDQAAKSAQDFADSQAPMIEAAKKEAERFALEDQARRAPLEQKGPQFQQHLAQQPSKGLRPYLATSPNEPPETSITKLVTGIATFAQMIGGGRAGARGALSAMTGALEGWQAGDRQRADRAFADWKARTEGMLDDWAMELRSYESWFRSGGMPLEQMKLGLELDARRFGNQRLADEIKMGSADDALKHLEKRQDMAIKINELMAKQVGAKEASDARLQANINNWNQQYDIKVKRLDEAAKLANEGTFSEEALENAARLYLSGTGKVPAFGMKASPDRGRFWALVAKLSPEYGGPAGIVARQSSIAGLKTELATVMKTRGLVEAFSETARKNLKDAEALSNKVDRSGSPMLNQWLLNGRKKWSGDPDVAEFDVAARTAINETARVLNSANASGVISDAARHEIEDMLNTALTPEQFSRAVSRLLKEMDNRRTSYDDQVKAIHAATMQMASPTPAQKAPNGGGAAKAASGGEAKTMTLPDGTKVTVR